ncbi:hypothetical protein PLESTM_001049400 [Pleodorina starrii]|nr:hypothetical protein PLESTM_001049400 [Pleodorina starrii]
MLSISAYLAAAVENSARVILRLRLLIAVITVIHVCGLREVGSLDIEPRVWLRTCVSNGSADELSSQVCLIRDDINFTRDHTETAVVPQSLTLIGVERPTVNLSGAIGLFLVAPNAAVSIRQLRLVDVALDETVLDNGASFLNLRAFNFSAPSSNSSIQLPAGQQPTPANPPLARLSLEDVEITTRSCQALSVLQAFACKLSPSPNFTVTPQALVVHSYTYDNSLWARNVTLGCTGTPLVHPCSARIVSSGAELLDLLSSSATVTPIIPDVPKSVLLGRPLYVYISRNITLRDAWAPPPPPPPPSTRNASTDSPPAPGAPPPPPAAAVASPPLLPSIPIYAQPLVLSGGTVAAAADGSQPPVAIDLASTAASLLTLATLDARMELHNLTLLNLPLGPAAGQPYALLALPIWTLSFPRNLLGWTRPWRLQLRGVAVQLERSELALWHQDTVGSVPDELKDGYCAWYQRILKLPVDEVSVVLDRGVQLIGGGLFLRELRSVTSELYTFGNILLTQQPAEQEQQQQQGQGQSTDDSAGPRPPIATSPLCQLRSEGGAEEVCLHLVRSYSGALTPGMLNLAVLALAGTCLGRNSPILLTADAFLQVGAVQPPVLPTTPG